MRMWPFFQIKEWVAYKRRAREQRVVASWTAFTNMVDSKGEKIGIRHTHVVRFVVDGNGLRSSGYESSDMGAAKYHGGLVQVRAEWRIHGKLPEDAERVDNRPHGKLVAIEGGKGAA